MRKSALRALLVVVGGLIVGGLALPSRALAQGGVLGSIVGNVFDQTGMPMPGVKIVAKSPTQIGGEKTTYSGPDGSFRIPALQPGVFELTASAPKMTAVNQKGLKVGVNAPAEANIVMEVATAQETVKVIEKAPIVSTKSANVKEVWDEEFIDNLPLETRTSVEELVTAAPGGSGDPGGRIARVRGGNQNQTLYLVDGFNLTGLKTTYKSLAAAEISTAGYGAEGAIAPGGLVSMVTKTGSNRWEFDISGFHEDSRLRAFENEIDKVPNDLRSYITPNVSGPIIKDVLWFYVNGEARNEIYSSYPAENGTVLPDQHYWNYRGTAKLTYQLNPRNKFQSFTFIDKNWSRNRNRDVFAERDAQQKRERYGFFSGLTWESLLTDNIFFKAQ
ncbi:MAG TPA: carboxypeptidase regulatory-like domain-containing protein, partial [Polyangia bacterium]